MKKLILTITTFLLVMGSTFTLTYATTSQNESLKSIQQYYGNKKKLIDNDQIIAVEAIGLKSKDFELYDIKGQDFDDMYLNDLTKTIIAMTLSGQDPKNVYGRNLVEQLESYIHQNGAFYEKGYEVSAFTQIWGIYALYVVESSFLNQSTEYLSQLQASDGSFGYEYYGYNSDFDTTGSAIEALALVDKNKYQSQIQKAIQFIYDHNIDHDGGYNQQWGANPNTQASILGGLLTYDKEGLKSGKYNIEGHNPYDYLLSLQNSDGSYPGYNVEIATSQSAFVMGYYEYENVFTHAKKAYQDLVNANQDKVITDIKESYNLVKSYYQNNHKIESYDDYLAISALGLNPKKMKSVLNLKDQDFKDLYEASLSKTILSLITIGEDPKNIKGQNLVSLLESYVQKNGSIMKPKGSPLLANHQVWCLYALYVTNSPKLTLATNYLLSLQEDDGGFGYGYGSSEDVTSWVIEILSLIDKQKYNQDINKAMQYLSSIQQDDGSYGVWGANSNSQAVVLSGFITFDKDGLKQGQYNKNGIHPFTVLMTFQNQEGWFGWQKNQEFNLLSTQQSAFPLGYYFNGNLYERLRQQYSQLITQEEDKEITQESHNQNKEQSQTNTHKNSSNGKSTLETTDDKKEEQELQDNLTQTESQVVTKTETVSNENPYIKYGLIVGGIFVVLIMMRISYSMIKRD